jgi:hypothetical protein
MKLKITPKMLEAMRKIKAMPPEVQEKAKQLFLVKVRLRNLRLRMTPEELEEAHRIFEEKYLNRKNSSPRTR